MNQWHKASYFRKLLFLVTVAFFIISPVSSVLAQVAPFDLSQILRAIAAVKAGRIAFRTIIKDVGKQKVSFPFTAENEEQLRKAGANEELLGAIKGNDLSSISTSNLAPKPNPADTGQPAPKPLPPVKVSLSNQALATKYRRVGSVHYDLAENDEAITFFTKSIEINPGLAETYYNRVLAYTRKDNTDAAITDYTRAIELDPKYSDAFNNRGGRFVYKMNIGAAIKQSS